MIAKVIKGKGFRGVLEYCLRQEKGFLLETNMAGSSPRELAKELGEIRKLRPNLSGAVSHVSIALSVGESLSDNQWREVAQKYLAHMGFTNNQFVAVRHTDRDHQHMHIIINRVTMDGTVVSDSHNYKRQEKLMRELEKELSLKQVTPSRETGRKALTKGEVEHAVRTGEPSARMKLQNLIDSTLQRIKIWELFSAALAGHGVEVRLNKASTGRVSGISFAVDGVALKGSDLGKAYSWNSLLQRGLEYEQNERDKINERSERERLGGIHLSGNPNGLQPTSESEQGASRLDGQERRRSEITTESAAAGGGCGKNGSLVRARGKGLSR